MIGNIKYIPDYEQSEDGGFYRESGRLVVFQASAARAVT